VTDLELLDERKNSITTKGKQKSPVQCESESIAGAVSQRACVYCGARVVLNPITDAVHLVHGPIGCASYTWDIRGSLSSGSELFRTSFSTDLREEEIIFGGEPKLIKAIDQVVEKYRPQAVFVYSTCVVGVIGDDLKAVCRQAARKHGIHVIPVESSGFIGSKVVGYRAACDALLELMQPPEGEKIEKNKGINFLGDFNLGGEAWIIKNYLKEIGLPVNVVFTGDSTVEEIKKASGSCLNIVQCAGSMYYLANKMEELYGIPTISVSFFGTQSICESLRKIADFLQEEEMKEKVEILIEREMKRVEPILEDYRRKLQGKKAAIYVGGAFKAISLISQFKELGMEVVMTGTQTGKKEDYAVIHDLLDEGAVIVDDSNPAELEKFMLAQGANLLAGGVKERLLAYKLGIAFLDHNHDRKDALAGFDGAVNFAQEVYTTVCSPVWKYLDSGEEVFHGKTQLQECS